MRRINLTVVCIWLRHFVGAEKVHPELTDSQSRHVSHLVAGRMLRQVGWTYPKTPASVRSVWRAHGSKESNTK